MTYSHFSRDFADLIRPVLSLYSKSEAAYSVKSILCGSTATVSPSRTLPISFRSRLYVLIR